MPSPWPIRDEVLTFHDVALESGAHVDRLDVHYRLEGTLAAARDNVVLIVHALTGDVRVTDWWKGVVEAGGAIDPLKHAVLTANLLGGCDGTTGPSNAQPGALPAITTRDQAAVLGRVLGALGTLMIFGMALTGFIFTVWLIYVEVALLKAICPFCVTSQVAMTLIFIMAVIRLIKNPQS